MDEEEQSEWADANYVEVLETDVLHVSDVIYWLDGSSAEEQADMRQIEVPLEIIVTDKPRNASVLSKPGKTAVTRRSNDPMVEGYATETQRTRAAQDNFTFSGEVWDRSRRYNPSSFNVTLGSANGQAVVLYPTPFGAQMAKQNCLFGRIVDNNSGDPVLWALMTLTVTIQGPDTMVFRAQSDNKGDFLMSFKGLPSLPQGINNYAASLAITADLSHTEDSLPDPSSFTAMNIESASVADSYGATQALTVQPGLRTRLSSATGNDLLIESP